MIRIIVVVIRLGYGHDRRERHVPFQIDLRPGVELPEGGMGAEVSPGDAAPG